MLQIRNVSRSYGARRVLNDVSFDVRPGRLTGFIGANGAGKTTTMRVLLGLLEPNTGEVLFNGAPITRAERSRFGYMPEERGLYPKMKVREQVAYFGELHGLSRQQALASTDELLELLDLTERAESTVEELSLGNQQRVQVAATLVHAPDGLVLDEPFSGLDPIAVDRVMQVLHQHAERGIPVLFSSHQLDIVERLCDDITIIAGGEIKATGEREALREQHAGSRYAIDTGVDASWVREIAGVSDVRAGEGTAVTFDAAPDASDPAQRVLAEAVRRGPVARFERVRPHLSEVFQEVIK